MTSDDLPLIYLLEGHGEQALPSVLSEQLSAENMETDTLSLLTLEAVPEDADAVLIYAPQSDISEDEKTKLASYLTGGGKLLVMAGPLEDATIPNLNSLLGDYGITVNEGIVVEASQDHYFYGYPHIMLPDLNSHSITDPLISEKYYAIIPIAHGLTVGSDNGTGTVTELLSTSSKSFSKVAGYAMETYEKEEGDMDGPFAVGVSIADSSGGQLVWFSTADLLGDMYVSYISVIASHPSGWRGNPLGLCARLWGLPHQCAHWFAMTGLLLQTIYNSFMPSFSAALGWYSKIEQKFIPTEEIVWQKE